MEIKIEQYSDVTLAKLRNRRVIVRNNKDIPDSIIIEFKNLIGAGGSLTDVVNKRVGNKICFTGLSLSDEAAISLIECLKLELRKKYPKPEQPSTLTRA